ncbi:hypothetical protein HBH56_006770 [Parastagonospora nodorum]|nr:hypothetical protein HBH56_006770 [Parastagonospora nodorum]KAH3937660.1 hypothetical protein HBH54_006770 [Parastagonospora nodorum]KAH4108798.1 hypothetical protein HBH46_032370 [Parastagonospora nodorum]KAH4147638.1 hypothetical protein HBH44_220830 [Parastagonospora nodorum]KAH4199688.1 hypothetical protein HBH42_034190 [Parastagonospora nodorum]
MWLTLRYTCLPYDKHAILGLNAISTSSHFCKSMACSPAYGCALSHRAFACVHSCRGGYRKFHVNALAARPFRIQYRSSFVILRTSDPADKKQCHSMIPTIKKPELAQRRNMWATCSALHCSFTVDIYRLPRPLFRPQILHPYYPVLLRFLSSQIPLRCCESLISTKRMSACPSLPEQVSDWVPATWNV